jgi:hypothetical protein
LDISKYTKEQKRSRRERNCPIFCEEKRVLSIFPEEWFVAGLIFIMKIFS